MNSYVYDSQIKFGYGSGPTYITVTKEKILPMLKPVGVSNTTREDGSVHSKINGWSEIVNFFWPTISITEFNYLLAMVGCNNSEVEIYFEPTTNPTTYDTYYIIYNDFNMGVQVYTASGAVRQNVSIVVGKAYA